MPKGNGRGKKKKKAAFRSFLLLASVPFFLLLAGYDLALQVEEELSYVLLPVVGAAKNIDPSNANVLPAAAATAAAAAGVFIFPEFFPSPLSFRECCMHNSC